MSDFIFSHEIKVLWKNLRPSFDIFGVPKDVPVDARAINEGSLGAVSWFFPIAGVTVNSNWINYIYYNQQRFINYTDSALLALGEQLLATSTMTWQNRQALDWVLAV